MEYRQHELHACIPIRPLQAGDIIKFLMRLVVCCMLLTYWVNPLPGVGVGFNKLCSPTLPSTSLRAFDQRLA